MEPPRKDWIVHEPINGGHVIVGWSFGDVAGGKKCLEGLIDDVERLRSALRGVTDYIEILDKAHPDLLFLINQLWPIAEMLPIWREPLTDGQPEPTI